jgi:hypothetical protein
MFRLSSAAASRSFHLSTQAISPGSSRLLSSLTVASRSGHGRSFVGLNRQQQKQLNLVLRRLNSTEGASKDAVKEAAPKEAAPAKEAVTTAETSKAAPEANRITQEGSAKRGVSPQPV